MEREQSRGEPDPNDRARDRSAPIQVGEPSEAEGMPGLGDIAQDALEHLKLIVNDSVELGKLEARKVVLQAKETAKEVAPRIAVGALAATLGFAGVVLALIALFIALGDVIPSVTVRLVIYAAAFLVLAAAGGFYASRPLPHRGEKTPREKALPASAASTQSSPFAPSRPVGTLGE